MKHFGSLQVVDGSTAQTGIGAVAVKIDKWASAGTYFGAPLPVLAGNEFEVRESVTLLVSAQLSFSGTISVTFGVHLAVDGVIKAPGTHRKLGTGGDVGSCSFVAPWFFNAGERASLYVYSDGAGNSMTLVDAQFTLTG